MNKKLISFVFPVFNEAGSLPSLVERLAPNLSWIEAKGYAYELIFIDDASRDETPAVLADMAAKDPNVKVVRFVRNFGSQIAINAGLRIAAGDCAIIMAADLQEPPEIVQKIIEPWETTGSYLVIGTREKITGSMVSKVTSKLFYEIMNQVGFVKFPKNGADVLLLDRKVLDHCRLISEQNPSIVGLILWLGYPSTVVTYKREERKFGKSGWTLRRKIRVFIDSITAFSYFPMRMMSGLGLVVILFGMLYGAFVVLHRLIDPETAIPGWSLIIILILFFNGFILLSIGVIGEYVWRILDEVRGRPLCLVEYARNYGDADDIQGRVSGTKKIQ